MRLALSGDVMTGRGIDQILPFPSEPTLHESYVRDPRDYVTLAEEKNGPIPRSVDPAYVWGDSLLELRQRKPDVRIINLETAVTSSEDWARKGINYRMNPRNIECLTAAGVDCAVLSNNHVLDWGETGLLETLESLHQAGIATAGAGRNSDQAQAPALLDRGDRGRIWVFGLGSPTSGIPWEWEATDRSPGVNLLKRLSGGAELSRLKEGIRRIRRPGDLVIVSIHWGENWGYEIPAAQVEFAHALIDDLGVDLVHGHSSHHVKGLEIHQGKLILYGCGDLITDYEGITGYEAFRGDLGILYFPELERETGRLLSLDLVPFKMRRFRLQRADATDVQWLRELIGREGRNLRVPISISG